MLVFRKALVEISVVEKKTLISRWNFKSMVNILHSQKVPGLLFASNNNFLELSTCYD